MRKSGDALNNAILSIGSGDLMQPVDNMTNNNTAILMLMRCFILNPNLNIFKTNESGFCKTESPFL